MDGQKALDGGMPKACRNCRQRKVRCDRSVPCSNCSTSGLACAGTVGSTVRASHAPTNNNSGLESRLLALEDAIRELRQQRVTSQSPAPTHQSAPSGTTEQELSSGRRASLPEGDGSFVRQSFEASRVMELASSEVSSSPAVMAELANLRTMTQGKTGPQHTENDQTPRLKETRISGAEFPPLEFVLKVLKELREAKGGWPLLYIFHGIRDYQQVEDLCKRIYFPVETPFQAEIDIFSGVLSIVLRELHRAPHSGLREEDIVRNRAICERNFQIGFQTYEVMANPTPENAMLLGLAMVHAQDKTKWSFGLEWSLTSAAARHCISLGYHREERVSQLPPLEAERARQLFWHVYIFDKNLSSRLGRPSTIQDYDVDVAPLTISKDPGQMPWDLAFNRFVDLSQIQGQIYGSLYSASARHLDLAQRSQRVSELASRLDQWHVSWNRIDTSDAYEKEAFDLEFGPATVAYYSLLTLCHRGANLSNSAHDVVPACYDAAQQGLKAHLAQCSKLSSSGSPQESSYTLWIFYYISFTPFVVTFLHCIANSDLDDLGLLRDVVSSLERLGPMFEYTERQFHLCKALHRVAEAFVETQRTASGRKSHSAGEFCLPLQNPFTSDWALNDSELQLSQFADSLATQWDNTDQDFASFSLGHQM